MTDLYKEIKELNERLVKEAQVDPRLIEEYEADRQGHYEEAK